MIRINLLPDARHTGRGGAAADTTLWAGIYLVAAVVLIGALTLIHLGRASELDERVRANAELQSQVEGLQRQTAGMTALQAQLEESDRVRGIIEELQRRRTGPARLLLELRNILSDGRGPTIDAERLETLRRENPNAGFDPAWDVRRLSLIRFTEEQGSCAISGTARTNKDVAEFLRRISLSNLFEDVVLARTEIAQSLGPDGKPLINFELSCRVGY
jgi:type IV pilus assembly protein PilN